MCEGLLAEEVAELTGNRIVVGSFKERKTNGRIHPLQTIAEDVLALGIRRMSLYSPYGGGFRAGYSKAAGKT